MTTPSTIARYSLIVGLSYHRAHLQLIYVGLSRTRAKVQLTLELYFKMLSWIYWLVSLQILLCDMPSLNHVL